MTDKKPQNCGTGYCSCIECPYDECVQDKGQCNNGCLMNKTTKALKLAEEAFEALVHTPIAGHIWTGKCNPALFAIREALAEQAEQEPVAVMDVFSGWSDVADVEIPYHAAKKLPDGEYKLYAAPVSAECAAAIRGLK